MGDHSGGFPTYRRFLSGFLCLPSARSWRRHFNTLPLQVALHVLPGSFSTFGSIRICLLNKLELVALLTYYWFSVFIK